MFLLCASNQRAESRRRESLPHTFGSGAAGADQCQSAHDGTPWEKIFGPASVRLRTPGNV